MVATHCLPSGSLGTGEVPVTNISTSTMSIPQIPSGGVGHGNVRGIVLLMTGLSLVPLPAPYIISNGSGIQLQQLATDLTADGWIVVMPPFNETSLGNGGLLAPSNSPPTFIQTDITDDAGHGSRMVAATVHWFDHIYLWLVQQWGPWPLIPFGVSWGGWHAWQIAINRPSQILAYGGMCGVTILSDVAATATQPANWTVLNTTGADVTSTALNSTTQPGWIGWSTLDTTVGDTDLMALYNAAHGAGQPVTFLQNTTSGHGLASNSIGPGGTGFTGTTIMDWMTGTVDPLAPKMF